MIAHFDNSANNPRNPSNPPVEVHWGEQTTDEMCIGFLQLTRDDEHLENRPPDAVRPPIRCATKNASRVEDAPEKTKP